MCLALFSGTKTSCVIVLLHPQAEIQMSYSEPSGPPIFCHDCLRERVGWGAGGGGRSWESLSDFVVAVLDTKAARAMKLHP